MTEPHATVRIRQARLIDPATGTDQVTDLYLSQGRVEAWGAEPNGLRAQTTIEAAGLVAAPGWVDLAARLYGFGAEHQDSVAREATAALHGGVTSLCCPPDTAVVLDTPAAVQLVAARAADSGFPRVFAIGALTQKLAGELLAEMGALADSGCVALGNARRPFSNLRVLRHCLQYASALGLPVILEMEDAALAAGGVAHEGPVATQLGLAEIPSSAETAAIAATLELVRAGGPAVHFGRISAARSVALIAAAQADGLPVSADVAAHQLIWTHAELRHYDGAFHTRPPLRGEADRQALLTGVLDGTIGMLCSDHQPHEPEAKMAPFAATAPGISAFETLLPLALAAAGEAGISLSQLVSRLSTAPARLLGIEGGTLAPGSRADLVLFDPEERWTLTAAEMCSAGHNNPLLGRTLKGRVRYTLLGGSIAYAAGR